MSDEINISPEVLIGRLTVIMTCLMTITITIVWGVYNSLRDAPGFVKIQIGLITLCNIAGMCFALFLWYHSIEEVPYTYIQLAFMCIYFGCSLLSYWQFAYQYLITSRVLNVAIDKMLLTEESRRRRSKLPSIMD